MEMKIGFAKRSITPPPGTELGGYAGYRPCSGCHDPLWCRAVVLQQGQERRALLSLELLSVDESLSDRIEAAVRPLGIGAVVAAAIHSHAAPCGMIPGEGPLAAVNAVAERDPEGFRRYMEQVIDSAVCACAEAIDRLEPFTVRSVRGTAPVIGSERHTGQTLDVPMTVVGVRTQSGRTLTVYQIPCHPTVLGPDNLLASADLAGGIEGRLDSDMAMFLNGAAGDISTRFTRRAQDFAECDRMAAIAAEAVRELIRDVPYGAPEPLRALRKRIRLQPRAVESPERARLALEEATARWQAAAEAGMEPGQLRILRTYVEGAGVALEFARTMEGIRELSLPVTAFTFAGLRFVTVPGELFSGLWRPDAVPVCYANGYYRYIADRQAYRNGYYETMAAIVAEGQGERLLEQIEELLEIL